MRRNDRRAVVAAKHMLPPVEPDDCCEHGMAWGDDCPECEAEVMEMLRSDEPAQEWRTTNG